ncbi:MAG: ankyrin repeat domain-containing protein [Legionellales bacterium]|nr:ankyrin repeat domain-containing protein [Legionellales bacterium]
MKYFNLVALMSMFCICPISFSGKQLSQCVVSSKSIAKFKDLYKKHKNDVAGIESAYRVAAHQGREDIIDFLHSQGNVDVNAVGKKNELPAVYFAIKCGHILLAEKIAEQKGFCLKAFGKNKKAKEYTEMHNKYIRHFLFNAKSNADDLKYDEQVHKPHSILQSFFNSKNSEMFGENGKYELKTLKITKSELKAFNSKDDTLKTFKLYTAESAGNSKTSDSVHAWNPFNDLLQ